MFRSLMIPTILVIGLTTPAAAQPSPNQPAGQPPPVGQGVPDAFSVEWQGKHPCEKLYEDAQIRVGRCTFPPGAVHVRHSHPGYFGYTLSGGKGQVRDERGTRQSVSQTGAYYDNPPIPWHEFANVGDTTISYLIVEKKYQPVPAKDQAASQ